VRLELHVLLDGAAFAGDDAPLETSTILHRVAKALSYGLKLDTPVRLRDTNGNRVGYVIVTANSGGCGDPDCSCPECPTGRENDGVHDG